MKSIKNFMIFLCLLFAFSYNQILKESLPLNNPRKLEENSNETILLGFENYNFTSPYDFVYFDTLFYLKNWDLENIEIMANQENNNFTIDTEVIYEKRNETTKFTCINNYLWFRDEYYNIFYSRRNCSEYGYCIAKYRCELNITGKGIPRKINITTNFTNKDINNVSKISGISSSAEALKREIVSLKYQTRYFKILKNANFTSQSPNSFKIKGKGLDYDDDSENIYLITTVNGSPKKILCSGKYDTDSSDDEDYYFLKSKGSNNLSGANLSYALLNYTTGSETKQKTMAVIDFAENSKNANGTILPPKVEYKKKSGGLSTGGICAIVIPSVLVLLGVGALAFFLSRRAVPSPPIKTIGNNTMGVVASSESALHQ
jgi:hypothetical protein